MDTFNLLANSPAGLYGVCNGEKRRILLPWEIAYGSRRDNPKPHPTSRKDDVKEHELEFELQVTREGNMGRVAKVSKGKRDRYDRLMQSLEGRRKTLWFVIGQSNKLWQQKPITLLSFFWLVVVFITFPIDQSQSTYFFAIIRGNRQGECPVSMKPPYAQQNYNEHPSFPKNPPQSVERSQARDQSHQYVPKRLFSLRNTNFRKDTYLGEHNQVQLFCTTHSLLTCHRWNLWRQQQITKKWNKADT